MAPPFSRAAMLASRYAALSTRATAPHILPFIILPRDFRRERLALLVYAFSLFFPLCRVTGLYSRLLQYLSLYFIARYLRCMSLLDNTTLPAHFFI